MHLISTRQIKAGKWTYFKAEDDRPKYFNVRVPGELNPDQLDVLEEPPAAVQHIVDEAKMKRPTSPLIVVFIHGYNNTVESAATTTGRIEEGLGSHELHAAVVCLSWSTDGRLQNYTNDRCDARASALAVSRIWQQFRGNTDIENGSVGLCVVSHSMGNYLMNLACEGMAMHGNIPANLFRHSILVAADINRDDLNVEQEGDAYCRMSKHVTFYYDGWDGTLQLAETLLHRQRFGKLGPHYWERLFPNTIGVSCTDVIGPHGSDPVSGAVQVGVEVHSAYFGDPTFYSDIAQTLKGVPPTEFVTRLHAASATPNSYRLRKPPPN
jgi:hypothetical protein